MAENSEVADLRASDAAKIEKCGRVRILAYLNKDPNHWQPFQFEEEGRDNSPPQAYTPVIISQPPASTTSFNPQDMLVEVGMLKHGLRLANQKIERLCRELEIERSIRQVLERERVQYYIRGTKRVLGTQAKVVYKFMCI